VAAFERSAQACNEVETEISENLGKRLIEVRSNINVDAGGTGAAHGSADLLDELASAKAELAEAVAAEEVGMVYHYN
jgi:hypothetical protein